MRGLPSPSSHSLAPLRKLSRRAWMNSFTSIGARPVTFAMSKDHLLAEATQDACNGLLDDLEAVAAGLEPASAVRKIAAAYLAQVRTESSAAGCALANLGTELKRAPEAVRTIALEGHQRFVRLLATPLEALHVPSAAAAAIASGMVSTLVGAVMLAQIAGDATVARGVLKNAQRSVEARLATIAPPPPARAGRKPRR